MTPDELTDLVQSTESERNSYSIHRGDIFVTRTSETSDELGMSCVALKDYPDATYNGFTKRMRPITDLVLPEYIGYYMRMPSFRGEFQAFSTMTTRASLKNEDLLSLSVSLPSLDEQNRIAQALLNYDNLIENNQKQIKLLEEAAQRLYKEWFVDLRFPGYEDVHIVDGVPEGWRKCVISDICDTVGGGTPSTSRKEYYDGGTIPWVTPTDLTKDGSLILLDTEKHITEDGLNNSSAKILPSNTILMTSRASIGYFALCEQEVCTNQGFISCIPKHEYIRYYLLYNLIRMDKFSEKDYLVKIEQHCRIELGKKQKKYDTQEGCVEEAERIEAELSSLKGEEREAVVKLRVNQGVFRNLLLEKYKHCCLCQVSNRGLLSASHIKPWSASTSEEKLDRNNGFLMCPNHDRLFDKGFISFKDDGSIMISEHLSETDRIFTNVRPNMSIELTEGNKRYLQYHRNNVYQ